MRTVIGTLTGTCMPTHPRSARFHVQTNCPNELCSFAALIGGCSSPEEAIEAGEAVGKVHAKHEHPGTEGVLTFKVHNGNDELVADGATSFGPVH